MRAWETDLHPGGPEASPPTFENLAGGPIFVLARNPREWLSWIRGVRVNAAGQLGTATAASSKSSAKPLSGTVRHLVATVKRQQRQIRRLQREVQKHG